MLHTDAGGKEVVAKSLSFVSNGQSEKISVQGLAKGNYFLKVTTENGTETKKILIN